MASDFDVVWTKEPTVKTLYEWHQQLDGHFRSNSLDEEHGPAGRFLIDHNVDKQELASLRESVQSGRRNYSLSSFDWQIAYLPLLICAVEVGYEYEGNGTDFWPKLSEELGCEFDAEDREKISWWFARASSKYRAVTPGTSLWEQSFCHIAWPITHAVAAKDIRRPFADCLRRFRRDVKNESLNDEAIVSELSRIPTPVESRRFQTWLGRPEIVGGIVRDLLGGKPLDDAGLFSAHFRDRLIGDLRSEPEVRRAVRQVETQRIKKPKFELATDDGENQSVLRFGSFFLCHDEHGGLELCGEMPELSKSVRDALKMVRRRWKARPWGFPAASPIPGDCLRSSRGHFRVSFRDVARATPDAPFFTGIDEQSVDEDAKRWSVNKYPQSLKQDTLRFVASNSADFTHCLLLTASPNLRDMRRFLELLQILEPNRIERARREADGGSEHDYLDWSRSRIGDLSDQALKLVYERFKRLTAEVVGGQLEMTIEADGVSNAYETFAEFRRIRVLTATRWRYRSVLRSYRNEFPDHLPRRIPQTLVVEATNAERDRTRASLSYVGELLRERRKPEARQYASALLQRVVLGGQSLQTHLNQLRRGRAEHEPRLVKMSELSRREYADSRLDGLVDLLVRFWQDSPNRKVVIAAGDNATVEELGEELAWRIPAVGPRGNRIDLKTVLAKDERVGDQSDDEVLDSQTLRDFANSTLRSFEESNNQLLIAHNVYRQSYNLQAADALIFYALPWKSEDVDQWIGRVDRLGREFVDPEQPHSRPRPVHIVTLHRRGDPTIGVQNVLDEYRIFETAIDPERSLLEQISSDIEDRTLPDPSEPNGEPVQSESDFDGEQDDVTDPIRPNGSKETAAPSGSPWTVSHAVELHRQVSQRSDLGPVLR